MATPLNMPNRPTPREVVIRGAVLRYSTSTPAPVVHTQPAPTRTQPARDARGRFVRAA